MERGLETIITTIRIAMYHFMKGSGLAGAAHLIFMRIGFARSVLVWTRDFLFGIGLDWIGLVYGLDCICAWLGHDTGISGRL